MNIKDLLKKVLGQNSNFIQAVDYKSNRTVLFKDYFINFLIGLDGEARSRSYSITVTMAMHIIDGLGDYYMSEINKDVARRKECYQRAEYEYNLLLKCDK